MSGPNDRTAQAPKRSLARYRMHDLCGKKIAGQIRPAGEFFMLDRDEAAKHPELTEVDADGKPVPTAPAAPAPAPARDKAAERQTGEAQVSGKR